MSNSNDPPPLLDQEEVLLWATADGLQRSLLRRISIARQEAGHKALLEDKWMAAKKLKES